MTQICSAILMLLDLGFVVPESSDDLEFVLSLWLIQVLKREGRTWVKMMLSGYRILSISGLNRQLDVENIELGTSFCVTDLKHSTIPLLWV
ncbi:hypothetical protein ABKN59_010844 [Abortiporus biennis]